MLLPVIMAGGSGTRLWPLSRTHFPKQFHSLNENSTLLEATIRRLDNIEHIPPLIICNDDHRFLVAEQLRKINAQVGGIILEPIGKNTCPAIALAAYKALSTGEDPLLLVLAADHAIGDTDNFIKSINQALISASSNKLVTFGIIPDKAETGYGYIKKGHENELGSFIVDAFKEKPNIETAELYLNSGEYLWNSGMFLFKASAYIKELELYNQQISIICKRAIENATDDLDFIRIDKEIFSLCEDSSIDYAIMEHTSDAVVVPMNAKWSDVGSWSSLWDIADKDKNNNLILGDVVSFGSKNSYIRSDGALTATVGVNNLIIVNTKDALLVADKNNVQDIKLVVEKLKESNKRELEYYPVQYRAWGEMERIESHGNYIVNSITILPGAKISQQLHYHRSEHWIVVAGTAKVDVDGISTLLTENESTYIRIGQKHSIMNPGLIPLKIIEIQSGKYIEEDDVLRIG